ncbi:MAG: aminodeoxychorismate/anthranilate synthase component II [Calditrichaceae bacterium]|nr:aminodeoxychorismate/anthranilate synthase component II [Calditrichaceae bacterium]MBN2707702.1 aminodeoxychorismate/anthranilate synthase component II [Calditrichaceae bacterium]RQV96482.1 MAG: aminodeoxychorismate/anthranilate synthase component II [Calditrichota bacterium]
MILFIDNYDSFTYNLVDLLGQLEPDLKVIRNDELTAKQAANLNPRGIVISPGPGTPDNAGISCDLIREYGSRIPILGVCLGHQSIGQVFGAKVIRAAYPVHGKTSAIKHNGKGVFKNIATPLEATRYHSLIIDRKTLPDCLEITAETEDNVIMGIIHREYPITGVQFHPESILTLEGPKILANWLGFAKSFSN